MTPTNTDLGTFGAACGVCRHVRAQAAFCPLWSCQDGRRLCVLYKNPTARLSLAECHRQSAPQTRTTNGARRLNEPLTTCFSRSSTTLFIIGTQVNVSAWDVSVDIELPPTSRRIPIYRMFRLETLFGPVMRYIWLYYWVLRMAQVKVRPAHPRQTNYRGAKQDVP